ncbi:hypothetical protein GQ457_14G004700 [Hibiscus cannabinus]
MPENPSIYAGAATGVLDGDRPALASSLVNGRPPDRVPRVASGPVLEKPGSPLAEDVQSDNKKVRNQGDVAADESVTEMDVEADIGMNENPMRSGDFGQIPKYGWFSSDGMELDLHKEVVLDEDCVVDREDLFNYKECDYCTFAGEEYWISITAKSDSSFVETVWGITPWSRSFSTSEKHPSRVVVWVRLPGLPYHYYSKALFRRIAAIVGEVVRVDYNMQAEERGKFARLAVTVDLNKPLVSCIGIDDFTQQLEYEGLQNICFKCDIYGHSQEICTHNPMRGNGVISQKQNSDNVGEEASKEVGKESLFGPWMVVDPRRRRPPAARGVSRDVGQDKGSALGSRKEVGEQQVDPVSQGVSNDVELLLAQPSRAAVGKKGKVTEARNSSGKKVGTGQGLVATAVVLPMVERQQASLVEHTGHSKVHTAISIFEQGHGKAGNAKIGTGKQVVGKAKGLKENAKQGLKIRKSAEMRTVSRPVLSDWIDNMNSQLDSFAMDKELDPGEDTRVCVNQERVLEKVPSSKRQALSEARTEEIEASDRVMDLAR